MRYLSLILVFIIHSNVSAQSPYLSILVKMDSIKAASTRYKIEMKICAPKKMTERGGWFTHDTSKINFASLKAESIECGEYFENGMPTLLSGEEEKKINQFEFANQVFAWENIFVFRISNASSRGWQPEMYVVMPMKYKSFVTHIKLNDIEFQSGKVIFVTNYNGFYNDSGNMKYLDIDQSLKNFKSVDVKNFSLKTILEKE
jgi:hypothetical protein